MIVKAGQRGQEYRSIVIRYRPGQRLAVLVSMALLVALLSSVAFYWGAESRHGDYQQLQQEKRQLQLLNSAQQQAFIDLKQQQANLEVSAQVDRLAVEEVRQQLAKQQQQIAELTEENRFYQGLMAPSELDRGLSLRGWRLSATADPRRFVYKLVVQQFARKHRLLTGNMSVNIVGQQQGKLQRLPLHTLSAEVDNASLKLRFKYFQTFEGELLIPQGFVPEQVEVKARAIKPGQAQLVKSYPWVVE